MDWEAQLSKWLEEKGITDSCRLSPISVVGVLNVEKLEVIGKQLTTEQLKDVLTWLELMLAVQTTKSKTTN